jgi:hypothetical protein
MTVPKAFGWALGEGLLLADRRSRSRTAPTFWTTAVGMQGDSPARSGGPSANPHREAVSHASFLSLCETAA